MLETLPLFFIPTWLLITIIVIGVILIGVFILTRLIKIAFVVGIIILIILGARALIG